MTIFSKHPHHPQHNEEPEQGASRRQEHKAHEAYARCDGHDEMPPFTPGACGAGGLFAEGAENAEDTSVSPAAELSDEGLAALCRERVCPSCTVHKEATEAKLRALADVENTKKRLVREKEEQVSFAAERVLADIVPSLDNLDLALQHAGTDPACSGFVTGVRMTQKLMLEALARHGLSQVGAVGEAFDPALHEAVGMAADDAVENGCICALLTCGYSLKGRILRPARVMVCRK